MSLATEYDQNNSVDDNEIIVLINEALKLGSTACHFDKAQNYVGACDYYDKCLLNMDEVLNKLKPDSPEWKKLYEIRVKYDDRMEFLRDQESSNFGFTALGLGKSDVKPTKSYRKRKKMVDFETDFNDIDWNAVSPDTAPDDPNEATFWILRNIKKTIVNGGFLTKDIFVPKRIWIQNEVKINGFSAKTAAYDIVLKLITNHVDALYLSKDEDSLDLADAALSFVLEEMITLQNQLSKPFPYIKEITNQSGKEDLADIDGTNTTGGTSKSGGGTPASAPKGSTLSGLVSSFSKNVRKYAEVGFQRLVVALPSKLSAEELDEYTSVIVKLCDKCQVFDSWRVFIKNAKDTTHHIDAQTKDLAQYDSYQHVQLKLNSISNTLVNIAAALRDTIIEIIFKDMEYLIEKYLNDTRKGFSRMYWDDEGESGSEN